MNRRYPAYIGILAGAFLLGLVHSVSVLAGVALAVCGFACYWRDSESKNRRVKAGAFANNSSLIVAGVLLVLVSVVLFMNPGVRGERGFLDLVRVLGCSFAVAGAPVMLWYHITKRRYVHYAIRNSRPMYTADIHRTAYFEEFAQSAKPAKQAEGANKSAKAESELQYKLAV